MSPSKLAPETAFTLAGDAAWPDDMELQKNNADFVRNGLGMATYDQPKYIARILNDSRQRQIDAGKSELKDNDGTRGAAWVCSA